MNRIHFDNIHSLLLYPAFLILSIIPTLILSPFKNITHGDLLVLLKNSLVKGHPLDHSQTSRTCSLDNNSPSFNSQQLSVSFQLVVGACELFPCLCNGLFPFPWNNDPLPYLWCIEPFWCLWCNELFDLHDIMSHSPVYDVISSSPWL